MTARLRSGYWVLLAHLLLAFAGRPAQAAAPSLQGSSREAVKSIPPVVCPGRAESASYSLRSVFSVVYAFTEGSFVRAVHAGQTDELRSPGLNPQLTTGRQERVDVKKKIRAWAALVDDEGTAEQIAEEVRRILSQRPPLIDQHRELRRRIHDLETQIDGARAAYAQRAAQASQDQDAREAASEAGGTFDLIPPSRRLHRETDALDLQDLDLIVSLLRQEIEALEGADDSVLDQVAELDAQVDGFLGSPATCTVAEVGSVEYIAMEAPLDANPNVGGGRRIFPDAPTAGAGPRRDVKVRATANPRVPGLMVHFKPFDRDDPSSDRDVLDANGSAADDNFSAEKPAVDGSPSGVDKPTSGDGTAEVVLRTTLQPGDNYDVAAGCDREKILALTAAQVSRNEASFRITAGPLTTWRKLHVERDVMPVFAQPGPANYAPVGTIQSVVRIDKQTVEVSLNPDEAHRAVLKDSLNRFDEGVLREDGTGTTYDILESRLSEDGTSLVVRIAADGKKPKKEKKREEGEKGKPQDALPSVGAKATVFDDDFDATADRRLPAAPPPLGTAVAVFRDAYVEVVDSVPGSENPDAASLPQTVNFDTIEARREFMKNHFQADEHRQEHFWAAYAGEGFQSLYPRDFDPDVELGGQPEAGVTDRSAQEAPLFASVLWRETERDFAAFSEWTPDQVLFVRGKTVAHELAHQFGVDPTHQSPGGLMSYDTEKGGSNDKTNPSPLLMRQLRHVREWPESPGRRTRESE